MSEPLAKVYVSPRRPRGSYHRAGGYHQWHHGTWTACSILALDHADEIPETEAVLTREPCHYCFILWRGRRQDILNQLASVPLEEPA
jgi:hypothetical protein